MNALFLPIPSAFRLPKTNTRSIQDIPKRRPRTSITRVSCVHESNVNKPKNILVLGGTGRVGTETIRSLVKVSPIPLKISIAGRSERRGKQISSMLTNNNKILSTHTNEYNFVPIELSDKAQLSSLISAHDLVIHTAGPFQRRENPTLVLESAMSAKVPYMDVCDDLSHARECKKLHDLAQQQSYTGLISTGIYPGLSNLLAAEACSRLPDGVADSLALYYHTAGTGGIGATVLASTFLILGEPALCFSQNDGMVFKPPAGEPEVIDFEGKIGRITTYLMNLPEVASLREYLAGVEKASVEAKFSTGPPVWNWLLQAMARWTPREWLTNRDAMLAFAKFSMPVVKAVDKISGARTGIQAVARGNGKVVRYCYEHERLAECVGEATAAFAVEMIKRIMNHENESLPKGILYPEELSGKTRGEILKNASLTCNFMDLKEKTSETKPESLTTSI